MLTAELTPDGARVRDARPGCLTARPSTSSPPFRCSRPRRGRTWWSSRACCAGGRVREGEILWRQGDERAGAACSSSTARVVGVAARARGSRRWRSATAGPGETVGEIALLDGGGHTMSVRVTETATVLALGRRRFRGAARPPGSVGVRLKRRLAALFTARLRNQLAHLAASLGGDAGRRRGRGRGAARSRSSSYCGPPDSKYVRRMATFHDFDPLALWGFLTSGSYATCPPGRTLLAEGAPSDGLLPHDQRRRREGADPRRPAHPRRPGGAGQGVRLREPHRRSPVAGHRDHARAGAAARAAARAVRAALQRRGRRLARLPRRDPARPGGHAARRRCARTRGLRRASSGNERGTP